MSTFTPADVVDMNKEKDWAAAIGMMDWDNTRVVFTKRTLIEFLRYTGTTVDTNFSNIQKLPRYATFGKLSAAEAAAAETTAAEGEAATTAPESTSSRDIFSHYVDDDALANAPPKNRAAAPEADAQAASTHARSDSFWDNANEPKRDFRPTRRVREMPGGRDSIADIL